MKKYVIMPRQRIFATIEAETKEEALDVFVNHIVNENFYSKHFEAVNDEEAMEGWCEP